MDEEHPDSVSHSVSSHIPPNIEHRRQYLGSQSRFRQAPANTSNLNSGMFLNNLVERASMSVMSEDEQGVQAVVWGTNLDLNDLESRIRTFLQVLTKLYDQDKRNLDPSNGPYYMGRLRQAFETDIYNISVDAQNIYEVDRKLYNLLTFYPAEVLIMFDKVLNEIYRSEILSEDAALAFENNILTRCTNLKFKSRMRELNPKDINHLISIQGIIIKTSEIYPDMKDAHFKCTRCSHVVNSMVDRGKLSEPMVCPRCNARQSFELIHNLCNFTDKQFVKMQETPETVPEGETPQNVNLILYDDMVDCVKPGDRVEITGIYRAQPSRMTRGKRILLSVFKTYIDVISSMSTNKSKHSIRHEDDEQNAEDNVQFTPEEESRIRELSKDRNLYKKLEAALAPSIWENEDVKKGILCQLFAGTKKDFTKGARAKFRNDINILLVGDPSVAKSQLLQFVHKIVPRGIYTSGKGSSAVGLTAYITKDPETREIVLESGALVLSDKGICCIDEFDKMTDDTKTILHEVMEQQTISIAKNGIVCSLNARTAILAAANPKDSRYNMAKSLVYNIQLPPTLMSRFDLIYLMLDRPNERSDRKLAEHLLSLYAPSTMTTANPFGTSTISRELFAKYITFSRKYCNPEIPEDVTELLIDAYLQMRNKGRGASRTTITATPRQLESLIRISEALAKMRLSDRVEAADVREASRLIEVAIAQSSINPVTGLIDMDQLNTGFAEQDREKINTIIPDIINALIKKKEEVFKNGIRGYNLKDEVMNESEGKLESLSHEELLAAVTNMVEQGILTKFGDSKDKYTVKLAIRGHN